MPTRAGVEGDRADEASQCPGDAERAELRARRQYIPAEIAAAAGLTEEGLFSLKPSAELRRAVQALAAAAERNLATARALPANRAARPLLLLAPLARAYLRQLRRRGYEVMARPIEISPAGKIARLWWAARTGL